MSSIGARVADGGEIAPHLAKSQNGAPQPMKMGTIAPPWRYDAAAAGST
jgi:hypothetical protein